MFITDINVYFNMTLSYISQIQKSNVMDVASTLQSYFCCCLSVRLTNSCCLLLRVKCFGLMTGPTMTEGDGACKTPNLSGLIARLGLFCCLRNKWFEWSVICHLNVAVTVIFDTQTTGSLLLFSKRMGCWDKEKWMHPTCSLIPQTHPPYLNPLV